MRGVFFFLALLGLLLVGVLPVWAEMSGLVEWRYADYAAEEGGTEVEDASHFTQLYSLLYQKKGLFNQGRAGRYDFSLGAQWASLDSSVDGQDFDDNKFKVLYGGDILFAPGGLPFNLHLYSNDLGTTGWDSADNFQDSEIIDSNIITTLGSGQHIRSGATLMVGIRNGSYLGTYREVLSQLPRLFVDYSEDYVRDFDSFTPQHYRTRNLAFVSLNKKDNWFHYRLYEYRDFEDEDEDYDEKTIMLGTIDHTLTRQWINFTNWLKISTDGSLITTTRNQDDDVPEETFNYNFFAVATRSDWNASAFPSMSRTTDESTIEKSLEIPLFFQREVDPDTSYRVRLIVDRETESDYDDGLIRDETDAYLSLTGDLHRTRSHIFAPRFEAEMKTGNMGEGFGVSAGAEYYTNRAFRPPVDWYVSYSLTNLDGTSSDDTDVDYWENQLLGRIEVSPLTSLRTGVQQRFVLGTGSTDSSITDHISIVGDTGLVNSSDGTVSRTGETYRSTSTLFADHQASRRLSNRVELIYDYLSTTDSGADSQVVITHSLRYNRRDFLAKMRSELAFGDDINGISTVDSDLDSVSSVTNVDKTFTHSTTLRYSPGRIWEITGDLDYYWQTGDEGTTNQIFLNQAYRYSFFKNSGALRKFVEVREEMEYERSVGTDSDRVSLFGLLLAADFYPSRRTLVGGRVRYRIYEPESYDEYLYTFTSGINYSKFTFSLDYSYGIRSAYDDEELRNEHRWEVKVRREF